jgi:hypothetical protein
MSSTLEQIREFTTLGEARAFAVNMMDSGHLVDVRQQAVYKTLRRLSVLIRELG